MKHSTAAIKTDQQHPKTRLKRRSLISGKDAAMLANLFKVMANDTRVRLLHALARAGELCMTDLAAAVAMKPQAVSNQLQKLVDRGVLEARRDGNHVFYRIIDPCVINLLESGWCLAEDARRRVFPREL